MWAVNESAVISCSAGVGGGGGGGGGVQAAVRNRRTANVRARMLAPLSLFKMRYSFFSRWALRYSSTSRATLLATPVWLGDQPSARALGLRTF